MSQFAETPCLHNDTLGIQVYITVHFKCATLEVANRVRQFIESSDMLIEANALYSLHYRP